MIWKSKRIGWTPVVAGVLKKQHHCLLGLRPPQASMPGVWEFPGGKIEVGETPEVALEREFREELGIEIQVGPLLTATTYSHGETHLILLFYGVHYWKGEPKPQHHSELKWVAFDQVDALDLPAANRRALPMIKERLGVCINSK